MAICKNNPLRKLLKEYDFNSLLLPRGGIAPFDLMTYRKRQFDIIGNAADLFEGTIPTADNNAATNFEGQQSGGLTFALGVDLLKGIFEGFGLNIDLANLNAAFKKQSNLNFSFKNVMESKVDALTIDTFLRSAKLSHPGSSFAKKLLDSELYIVNSVLSTNDFSLQSSSGHNISTVLDLPLIEKLIASAKLNIEQKGDQKKELAFKGEAPIVFALRAYRLVYKDGKLEDINATKNALVRAGGNREYLTAPFQLLGSNSALDEEE